MRRLFLILPLVGLVILACSEPMTQPQMDPGLVPGTAMAPSGPPGLVTIPIPTTSQGLTINLVTGETSETGLDVDGWDVNVSGTLTFSANTRRPAREAGFVTRVNRREGGIYNLPLDFEVGPDVPFIQSSDPTNSEGYQYNWSFPGDANYVGVKFWNETSQAYHYGWMRFCVSDGLSLEPRALVEYAYETEPNTPIKVGAGGDGSATDCGAGGLTTLTRPFCSLAQDIRSATIPSLVLTASPSCNELGFLGNVDYVEPGRAPWENTTLQGPSGKPVDVVFSGLDPITQGPRPYELVVRTLTLQDVNLDPGGFDLTLQGRAGDRIGFDLENGSVIWDNTPDWRWPAAYPLDFQAVGGFNQLKGMKGPVASPTMLTVESGSTLQFVQSGNLDRGRPDEARLFFSSRGNEADIEGTLEVQDSYVIFGTGTSQMFVRDGGRLIVSGGNTVLRTGGDLTVENGGAVELGRGGPILDAGDDDVNMNGGSITVAEAARVQTSGLLARSGSRSTIGLAPAATVNVTRLLDVEDGATLILAGTGNGAGNLFTGPLFLGNGSLLGLTGEVVLVILPGVQLVWDEGAIEIGPRATLVIRETQRVTTKIPVHLDGTLRLGGLLLPESNIAGDGLLQVTAGGILDSFLLTPVSVDPAIEFDLLSTLRTKIDPTAGSAAKLIANKGGFNRGAFLDLNVTNDVVLAPGTQFTIIEYPEGSGFGGLFRRPGEPLNALKDGDEITAGLNTYRINYNDTNVTLTVVGGDRVKANSDYYDAFQDQTLSVPAPGVLGNDVNVAGTPVVVDPPKHGNLTLNADGSFTYTPNAGFFGDDSFTYQVGSSNVATVGIHVRAQGSCTRTHGYWHTHGIRGSADFDATWLYLPEGPLTPFFLSGQSYLDMVGDDTGGNPYYILAQQYVATDLNFLKGADPSAVQSAFDQATALFEQYTPAEVGAMHSSDSVYQQFIDLSVMLDDYNNGRTGPGYCDG